MSGDDEQFDDRCYVEWWSSRANARQVTIYMAFSRALRPAAGSYVLPPELVVESFSAEDPQRVREDRTAC